MWVLIPLLLCVRLRVATIMDSFGEIRTRYRRFEFVLVVDPIHWRFDDHPLVDLEIRTGSCSEDQTI